MLNLKKKKGDNKKTKPEEKKGKQTKKGKPEDKPKAEEPKKEVKDGEPAKVGHCVLTKLKRHNKTRVLETNLGDQFNTGRLYARIASRPGQVGRADGYILEGEELAFYLKKLTMKKKK